jgi:hypothetical protein
MPPTFTLTAAVPTGRYVLVRALKLIGVAAAVVFLRRQPSHPGFHEDAPRRHSCSDSPAASRVVDQDIVDFLLTPTYLTICRRSLAILAVWLIGAVAAVVTVSLASGYADPIGGVAGAACFGAAAHVFWNGLRWTGDVRPGRRRRLAWWIASIAPSVVNAISLSFLAFCGYLGLLYLSERNAGSPADWELVSALVGAAVLSAIALVVQRVQRFNERKRELGATIRAFDLLLRTGKAISSPEVAAFTSAMLRGVGSHRDGFVGVFESDYCDDVLRLFDLTGDHSILRRVCDEARRRLGMRPLTEPNWVSRTSREALSTIGDRESAAAHQLLLNAFCAAEASDVDQVIEIARLIVDRDIATRRNGVGQLAAWLKHASERTSARDGIAD